MSTDVHPIALASESTSHGLARDTNSSNGTCNGPSLSQDPGRHFMDRMRQGSVPVTDEHEDEPEELNTINSSGGFLVVSTDKLSVKYTGVNLHGHDVGVVQANKPAPAKRLLYYFEMHVRNAGAKGQIAIGFTNENFKMRRHPGWEANTCGYHGDDGFLYRGQGKGEPFGPTYTTNDTIGAGINYTSQEFFFTKNGIMVGSVAKDMKNPLFPTVAVHSQNEEVEVNLGQKQFFFDIKEYEAQERVKQQITIERTTLPPNICYGLVYSYLLHYGYEDTLHAFESASNCSVPPVFISQEANLKNHWSLFTLSHRKAIRQLIQNGEIDIAFDKLHEWYPQIVQDDKTATCFLLHCQRFIELIRIGALEEAVRYGRMELAKFFELPEYDDIVKDCVTLLAYEQPQNSPVNYLLEDTQREIVADAVNAMILHLNVERKDSSPLLKSSIEQLLRQLDLCYLQKRSLNGDQGEALNLHKQLKKQKNEKC